jgi:hypothetical protein
MNTDRITKTVEFGLDIDGITFNVALDVWSDGMVTTSAGHHHGTFNEEDYETLLVTTSGPTILQITEAIDGARQAAWERQQERIQA